MNSAQPVNKIMSAVRRLTDALDAAEDADLTVALNAVRPLEAENAELRQRRVASSLDDLGR